MSVEHFTEWFCKNMPPLWDCPKHPIWMIEAVTSVLLYRQGQFQVQMFIVPGGYVIPEHTHPNVDSIEIFLGGQIRFSHSGKWVRQEGDGFATLRGTQIRVKPHDLHGGTFGPDGGVFLSSQEWLNGVAPHCVAADYTGAVMGPHHLAHVVSGSPVLTEQKVAASLEC